MTEKIKDRKVCGEFPKFCYRGFDKIKFAEDFIRKGEIRLRCIYSCRDMEEEELCDPTEGEGRTKEPGIVTAYSPPLNPSGRGIVSREKGVQEHISESISVMHIYCTCLPTVDLGHMRKELKAKHIVKITQPRKLAEDIYDYFVGIGKRVLVVGCNVIYDKGQILDNSLSDAERADRVYMQKPPDFKPDCEFRIVVINLREFCPGDCKDITKEHKRRPDCEFAYVSLGKPLEYVSLFNPD